MDTIQEKGHAHHLSESSFSSTQSTPPPDDPSIVRALDRRMLPLFCVFFFTDYLDRANIGNATLAGLQTDLNLSSRELSLAISAFYITYIMFEIPSNCLLKRSRASIYLSSIMLGWGLVTVILAFVTNFYGLFICRLILGIAQSGYVPAILYQMSLVYRPTENTWRVAILLTMASLSGIVSGPLAYATSLIHGSLYGWQYLFLLEGIPTVLLSFISYWLLFDDIQNVSWLTDKQKQIQIYRVPIPTQSDQITWRTFVTCFSDWKLWMFCLFISFKPPVSPPSPSFSQPSSPASFGYPTLTSQLLTAPPSLASSCFVLLSGYLTDRFDRRTPLLLIGFSVMTLGYILLLFVHDPWILYGALFIVTSGVGMVAAPTVGWSSVNFHNSSVRAIAVATVVMVGNFGGVLASFLYPTSNAPHHYFGNAVCLACAVLGFFTSGLTGFCLWRDNKRFFVQNSAHSLHY